METHVVLGAGGFIGWHLSKRLKEAREGLVVGADLKLPEFDRPLNDEFLLGDLRAKNFMMRVLETALEKGSAPLRIYQLAADMGGAGYIFTGENDSDIMFNSASINLNLIEALQTMANKKLLSPSEVSIFYSSSACIYPEHAQMDSEKVDLPESSAYPAEPDSEYGWEKLFSERLFSSFSRNYGFKTKIARYHNIYGPNGTWQGGKEKAPAAICRKIASLGSEGGEVEVWGDGKQSRSFLFIRDCIDATLDLMESDFAGPVNIGSEEMVTISDLVDIVTEISGKDVQVRSDLTKPTGVRGRNSNNDLIRSELGWDAKVSLRQGLEETYRWIESQVGEQSLRA